MSLIRHLTRIHLGEEVVEEALAAELARHDVRRPLVVADPGRPRKLIAALLADSPVGRARRAVFAPSPPGRPEARLARALAELFARSGCDGVLVAGERGTVELAKLVAVLAGGRALGPAELADPERALGLARARAPLLAVAIGAGSGAEASCTAAVEHEGEPLRLCGEHLVPSAAVFDPLLTVALDARATAVAAFEALGRCIEAVAAPGYDPPADAVALDGIARIVAALPRALEDGRDLGARRELAAGALAAGLASHKGQGGLEAMVRALGVLADPPPPAGALAAVLLPHLLAFNAPALGERRGALARALAGREDADPAEAVAGLAGRAGLPRRLGALGIGADLLEPASRRAEADPASGTNPRRIGASQYAALLAAAI
ncbi:MAG: iron-containing alcohol dehydrogenase [Geminicoccaceae bacterium]|nr:iron-containing alcohol dehydrogenase [Geminicoccaceae bacterium]